MLALAIVFVDLLISMLCIWLATKFSFVKLEFKLIAVIVMLVAIASVIPVIGWLASIALFIFLLMKFSGCSIGDAFWVVLFAKIFSYVALIGILTFW